jgi:endonuclease/exonuclease/phosphatase family metal-dependent hydrolase
MAGTITQCYPAVRILYDGKRWPYTFPPNPRTGIEITAVNCWVHKPITAFTSAVGEDVAHRATRRSGSDWGCPPHGPRKKQNGLEKRIMSFNSQSLKAGWKIPELREQLTQRHIDACVLQETRWTVAPTLKGFTVFSSPAVAGNGGVAIVVRDTLELDHQATMPATSTKEPARAIAATVGSGTGQMALITAHAPHGGKKPAEIEAWWDHFAAFVEDFIENLPRPMPVVVAGDLNAPLRGKHAKAQRETVSTRALNIFCCRLEMVPTNTIFEKPENRKTTFTGQHRQAQLDCILVAKRYASSVQDVYATVPPTPSDHRPLTMRMRLRLQGKKKEMAPERRPRWDALASDEDRAAFTREVQGGHPTTGYDDFAGRVNAAAREHLVPRMDAYGWQFLEAVAYVHGTRGHFARLRECDRLAHLDQVRRTEKKHREMCAEQGRWYTRRKKISPLEKFMQLAVQHDAQAAAEVARLMKQFKEQVRGSPAEAWKAVKRLTSEEGGRHFPSKSSPEEVKRHFEKVNGEERATREGEVSYRKRLLAPVVRSGRFSRSELRAALASIRCGRAHGLDGIPAEVLKLGEFEDLFLKFVNDYYMGVTPLAVLLTELVMIPKKGDARFVANCRGIALTSIFLKLLNRLLLDRLRALDTYLSPFQCGFRPFRSTLEQSLALRMIRERVKAPFAITYIDFSNAFPSVTPRALEAALRAWLVPEDIVNFAMRCYQNHTVRIQLEDGSTTEYQVKSGVLQGDTAAPYLFVLVLDCILNEAVEASRGVTLDGPPRPQSPTGQPYRMRLRQRKENVFEYREIPYLAFADDIALITYTTDDAERQLQAIQLHARRAGLELNVGKGKTELQLMNGAQGTVKTLDGKELTTTEKYTYLGTDPIHPDQSFESRTAKAWAAAKRLEQLWKNRNVDGGIKTAMFLVIVATSFYYGCASWPSTRAFLGKADSVFARLLKYCLRTSDQHAAFKYGEIPRPSSYVPFMRLQVVGHALRHQTALGFLLSVRPERLTAFERSIINSLDKGNLTADQQEELRFSLPEMAADRELWRKRALIVAEEAEEKAWRTVNMAKHRRWTDIARVDRRVGLMLLEEAECDARLVRSTKGTSREFGLRHFQLRQRINTWSAELQRRQATKRMKS